MQSVELTGLQPTPAVFERVAPSRSAVTSRLPSLDGWRAVSILMVLGFHSTFVVGFPYVMSPAFKFVFDGNLGVRFFFIISGFLITWLMILERDKSGSVNLREFYIRRCLRILPIYLAFLSVLAVLDVTGVAKQSPEAWIGNLTFTRNTFGGTGDGDSYSAHLWSLSVEEQFYLAWPTLFFIFGKKSERSILGILAVTILAAPAIRGINYMGVVSTVFGSRIPSAFLSWNSLKYFDGLAFGCLGAFLYARRREIITEYLERFPQAVAALGITLIFFPHFADSLQLKALTIEQIGPSFQALGFTMLLLHSLVAPEWGMYRLLNRQWVRQIGIWSYSIYIWQQLFLRSPQYSALHHVWWMGLWIVPLVVVTMISYYGLERPFFTLRSRHREIKLNG